MATYVALIRRSPGSAFGVDFPDFPGCISSGATLDAALRNATGALALHVRGMLEDGEDPPIPTALDVVLDDPDDRDALPFLVQAPEPKARAVRVNITMDEGLLGRMDAAAAMEGFTRSGYLAEAVRMKLGSGF